MTQRANDCIDALKSRHADSPLFRDTLIETLLAQGFSPTEIGWVVHHVLGTSMPEAVHLASVRASQNG